MWSISDLFSWFSSPVSEPADIVVAQDSARVQSDFQRLKKLLNRQGHKINIKDLRDCAQVIDYLGKLPNTAKLPDTILLDCTGEGNGADGGQAIIRWCEQNRPGEQIPRIHFLSLAYSIALGEAAILEAREDCCAESSFVSDSEAAWLTGHLERGLLSVAQIPESTTLRLTLNRLLNINLPLLADDKNVADIQRAARETASAILVESWSKGKISAESAVQRAQPYVDAMEKPLRYGTSQRDTDVAPDAVFYESSGFPVMGEAVFSLDGVRNWSRLKDTAPVLILQCYDPDIVPLLAAGKIAGLIVLSPYMASHLKLLCDTHMVSGLFGLLPKGQRTLSTSFNEEAMPDIAPYINGPTVSINGRELREGDTMALGLNGCGLAFQDRTLELMNRATYIPAAKNASKPGQEKLQILEQMRACFTTLFKRDGIRQPMIKVNLNTASHALAAIADGIGLVRTEQLVNSSERQASLIRRFLLSDEKATLGPLEGALREDYKTVMEPLESGKPVKIRLFDLSPSEILNEADLAKFRQRHGVTDIHGGAALDAWPELYRTQVRAIMQACKETDSPGPKLQVMMPAVRTEDDIVRVRAMINEEAEKLGIPRDQYKVGTMVETLGACKNAAAILKHCDFMSFGTNDLTQEFFGIGRGDLKTRQRYAEQHGFDPFKQLAPEIMELIRGVTAEARKIDSGMEIDICGAQASDPATAVALMKAGVDNISVNPDYYNMYILPLRINYQLWADAQTVPAPESTAAPERNAPAPPAP